MKYIIFYSNGHNGDIIHSKSFIDDISKGINVPCFYNYNQSPLIIEDLDVVYTNISVDKHHDFFVEQSPFLFINTWLWPYIYDYEISKEYRKTGITLITNYKIFDSIYKKINSLFGTDLKLKDIYEYIPSINFNKIDCSSIDSFISNDKNKKVLFCNGITRSGQSCYDSNMSELIINLASKYKDITFLATENFDCDLDNIKFTTNITQINDCDLNQIGYLSTFCDIIIGRNSGPFCFTTIKENVNNPNTTFYAFGHNENDCFLKGLDISSTFIFQSSENKEEIDLDIEKLVLKL